MGVLTAELHLTLGHDDGWQSQEWRGDQHESRHACLNCVTKMNCCQMGEDADFIAFNKLFTNCWRKEMMRQKKAEMNQK